MTDYPFENKNIDFAIAEIKGRYPETGYCMNAECDEVLYVLEGDITLTKKDKEPINLSPRDAVLLEKGELYFWEGNCKMTISCSPSWNFEQYRHIAEEHEE